jgi:hypothetical protein
MVQAGMWSEGAETWEDHVPLGCWLVTKPVIFRDC